MLMSDAQQPDPTTGPTPPTPPVPPVPVNPYAAQPAANPYVAQPANPYAQPAAAAPSPYATAQAGYPQAPVGPSRFNVLGLISLILGSLAFLFGVSFGWIPFVGFLPIVLALVGLVLGIVGLIVKNKGKGLAIAGTIVSGVALIASALITVVMLIAFSSLQGLADDWGSDDPSITQPDGDEVDGGVGSIDQPAAIGDTITFSDFAGADEWQVVVGQPTLDATADVVAADEFNSAPAEGSQYVVVPLDYTYLGAETGYPYIAATPEFIGNDGVVYSLSYASYPDSVFDTAELTSGGQAHANAVFEVPTAAVDGGLLKLTSLWSVSIHVALG